MISVPFLPAFQLARATVRDPKTGVLTVASYRVSKRLAKVMVKRLERCSVLMCLYKGDQPDYFEQAIDSIFGQTVKPNDVVIVANGALTKPLEQLLEKVAAVHKQVQVVRLSRNVGVGEASNAGLVHCKNELVAKMDADDIAVPERLEKQLVEFGKRDNLVLLGGQIAEFADDNPDKIVSFRRVPTTATGIRKFAKRRSPFNNQTVMFKKSVVLAVGGYPKLNRAEDYYLYSKIIANGYKVDNLADVLVKYRLNPATLARRKSWQNTKEMIGARNEIRR